MSLLVFGGATLQDFAFALMVGIVSGAYSSIFIAAPLLTIWKEREPEYARRKGQEPERGRTTDGHPARRRPILPRGGPAVTDGGTLALEQAEQAAAAQPAPSLGDALPSRPARRRRSGSAGGSAEGASPHGRAR